MRNLKFLLAAAPLALLAACGDGADDADATTDVTTTETTAVTEPMDAEASGPATRVADAGDYSGTYNYAAADGTQRSVRLNSQDSTYSYTADDGTERTGRYTIDSSGYRLNIPDYYGGPGYFVFRNNELYRLPEEIEVSADTQVGGEKYTIDTGAQFSREPEPGSPVYPDDPRNRKVTTED